MKENKSKISNIPYYKVAKEVLTTKEGLSEDEAKKFIESSSYEQIESKIGIQNSMNLAINGIIKSLSLDNSEVEDIVTAVYNGDGEKSNYVLESLRPVIEMAGKTPSDVIIDSLVNVHKETDTPDKTDDWDSIKGGLLYVKPIFEMSGIDVDEEKLEDFYKIRSGETPKQQEEQTESESARESEMTEEQRRNAIIARIQMLSDKRQKVLGEINKQNEKNTSSKETNEQVF